MYLYSLHKNTFRVERKIRYQLYKNVEERKEENVQTKEEGQLIHNPFFSQNKRK